MVSWVRRGQVLGHVSTMTGDPEPALRGRFD
jgi:hypothetical protein